MISVYGDDNCELFDLEKDPFECHNVWDDPAYSAVRSELTEKLRGRQTEGSEELYQKVAEVYETTVTVLKELENF